VNETTGVVKAKKAGQSTITAYANGTKKCYIRVTAYSTSYSGKTYGLEAKSAAYNKISLSWKTILNADGYEIERSTSLKSGYKKIATVSGSKTSYTDKTCTSGKKYYYRLRAYYNDNGKKYCGYSSKVSEKAKVAAPKIKTVSGKNRITVSWKKVSGANGYVIYRSVKKKSGYKKIATIKEASTVKYIDRNLQAGKKYYYYVKAYHTVSGKKVCGTASNVSQKKSK
jgi:lactocepin